MYVVAHLLIIISWLLESVCLWTQVIPIIGFHCIFVLWVTCDDLRPLKKNSFRHWKNCWLTLWIEVWEEEPDVVVEGGGEVNIDGGVHEDLANVDLVAGSNNFYQQKNKQKLEMKKAKKFFSNHLIFFCFEAMCWAREMKMNWRKIIFQIQQIGLFEGNVGMWVTDKHIAGRWKCWNNHKRSLIDQT